MDIRTATELLHRVELLNPRFGGFRFYLRGGLLCTVLSVRLSDKDKVNFEEIKYSKIVGRDL